MSKGDLGPGKVKYTQCTLCTHPFMAETHYWLAAGLTPTCRFCNTAARMLGCDLKPYNMGALYKHLTCTEGRTPDELASLAELADRVLAQSLVLRVSHDTKGLRFGTNTTS